MEIMWLTLAACLLVILGLAVSLYILAQNVKEQEAKRIEAEKEVRTLEASNETARKQAEKYLSGMEDAQAKLVATTQAYHKLKAGESSVALQAEIQRTELERMAVKYEKQVTMNAEFLQQMGDVEKRLSDAEAARIEAENRAVASEQRLERVREVMDPSYIAINPVLPVSNYAGEVG